MTTRTANSLVNTPEPRQSPEPESGSGGSLPAATTRPASPRWRARHDDRPAPRPPLPLDLEARARHDGRPTPRGDLMAGSDERLEFQNLEKARYMPLSRTTEAVLRLLLEGDLSRLRADSVASMLGISSTTLRRRLRLDHTSYQFLLDRARQYRCEQLLETRWLPGKCLADELGYVEVNSFYRAFRRWTGRSFSDYRRQEQR